MLGMRLVNADGNLRGAAASKTPHSVYELRTQPGSRRQKRSWTHSQASICTMEDPRRLTTAVASFLEPTLVRLRVMLAIRPLRWRVMSVWVRQGRDATLDMKERAVIG